MTDPSDPATDEPRPATRSALAELAHLDVETDPNRVRRRSRDFYWYSPVLKRKLASVTAEAVVTPRSEAEVVEALRVCHRHRVPVTPRGGGTGNYGQAMPLRGGIVIDLSALTAIREIGNGFCRVEAGLKLADLDAAARARSRQELRFHPSTWRTATIGGFIAGGSGGVGSIGWGTLRDRGNAIAARIVTAEAEPRILDLEGGDVRRVIHAYGTNGVITELTVPLAPAYRWVELIVGLDDFMTAVRCADAIAHEDGIAKKLVTVVAAPVPGQFLFPRLVDEGTSVILLMAADFAIGALRQALARHAGRILHEAVVEELPPGRPPLFEHSWNHTTLQALKHDRSITYLQVFYPPPDHVTRVEQLHRHFGDEVPMHLEFLRSGGRIACSGLPLVRFTSEDRLYEIIRYHNDFGCPIYDPHVFTLEEAGRKRVDEAQLAFKREADPLGILNPGKMLSFDQPEAAPPSSHGFMFESH